MNTAQQNDWNRIRSAEQSEQHDTLVRSREQSELIQAIQNNQAAVADEVFAEGRIHRQPGRLNPHGD